MEFRVSRFFLSSFFLFLPYFFMQVLAIPPKSPECFFKRHFLINASFKGNIFRLLLETFFLINFYFSRGAFTTKIMGKNLNWLCGCNVVTQKLFFCYVRWSLYTYTFCKTLTKAFCFCSEKNVSSSSNLILITK